MANTTTTDQLIETVEEFLEGIATSDMAEVRYEEAFRRLTFRANSGDEDAAEYLLDELGYGDLANLNNHPINR